VRGIRGAVSAEVYLEERSVDSNLSERVKHYLDLLRSGDQDQAFHSLIEESPEVLPLLMKAFSAEKDPGVREWLVQVIWEHRVRETIPFLISVLDDDEPGVWKSALDGLVTIGGESALAALEAYRTRGVKSDREEWIAEAAGQIRESLQPDPTGGVEPEGSGSAARSPEELISSFEKMGFVIVQGRGEYELITQYVGKNNIPTWTSSDEKAGTVTIHKRAWGSLEGLFIPL